MKKVLLLPLLNSMPSGHHQVADAICESIQANTEEIECKKLDILSEWNNRVEHEIVKGYLGWIRRFPESYAWIYRQFAYRSKSERPHRVYEILFMKKVKDILQREQPDLIICTHGFSSLFINRLKESGECTVPVVNIYTDFFINDVWGRSHIDYHFVPSIKIKSELSSKYNIGSSRVFVTGIPISGKFLEREERKEAETAESFHILVSGGSVGLGNLAEMLKRSAKDLDCRVKVLCGANKKLYEEIKRIPGDFAEAYPYIASKEEMNTIYENSDAIISKPGGVTVSEAIRKDLPIFISSALPGQEQINLQLLNEMGLVFIIPDGEDALDFACRQLKDRDKMRNFREAAARYRSSFELADSRSMFKVIEHMLERS
ncbi:glycosyltransferase [Planomicrobium sp. Y74]|uniref:MGDG synthase family glycosyltransferase n=1 Tax=Planomicrobium sp. Y74 TaxID=2478977 RepID=UPI000EF534EA|nr:glycosyltransferase [Planomicrobium sp. Y74]RLQ83865.1 galactosyldiacylglycerol synthase [Planomicrobium sp. Y74]